MARNQQQPVPYRGGDLPRGYDSFTSLHREIDRLFDDVSRSFGFPSISGRSQGGQQGEMMMQPDIDVSENEKEFKICADLPGVSEEDVDVRMDDHVLTIKAERRQERNEEKENYHLIERSHGMFQRSLGLPSNIQADQVHAQFKDGVLEICIPKSQEAEQRSRRIQIGGGQQHDRRRDQEHQTAGVQRQEDRGPAQQ